MDLDSATEDEIDEMVNLADRMMNWSDEELEKAFALAQFGAEVIATWPQYDQDKYFKRIEMWKTAIDIRNGLNKLIRKQLN